MRLRRVTAGTAGAALAICLLGTPAGVDTAIATPSREALLSAQPSTICGYTDHARRQMALRSITEFDVQLAVALAEPFLNNKGNWQFDNGGMSAVLNDEGCVVTVMLR